MTINRIPALREALQDILDVGNITSGSAWYAKIARQALDIDDIEAKKIPRGWTGPEEQRLFNAWRKGDHVAELVVRFGRTEGAIRQKLHQARVRRTPEILRKIHLIARHKRI